MTTLTDRERQIVDLLAAQRTTQQIARALGLSTTATNEAITRLCIKLGAASRRDLAERARAFGQE